VSGVHVRNQYGDTSEFPAEKVQEKPAGIGANPLTNCAAEAAGGAFCEVMPLCGFELERAA
jgi:hypothetical protein